MKSEREKLIRRLTDKTLLNEIAQGDELFAKAKYYDAISKFEEVMDKLSLDHTFEICELYRKIGNCYYRMNDKDNSIKMYEKTLEYCTTNASIYSVLAYLYYYVDNDTALNYYRKALELDPLQETSIVNKALSILKSDRYSQKRIKDNFERDLSIVKKLMMKDKVPFKHEKPQKKKVLHIGYLSSDFHTHAMMQFIVPLLEAHNTYDYDFTLYSTGAKSDYTTEHIKSLNMKFKDCHTMTNEELATLIYNDKVDILVDLGGFTHCRCFTLFYKPAPIQMQYLGFVNTMGMPDVDYIFADEFTIPESMAQYYTEKPLYLDTCMNRFNMDVNRKNVPAVDELPYHSNGYITFGSFNCPSKINNYTISLWAKILDQVPNSKLLLYRTQLTPMSIEALKNKFINSGVDLNRVIFDNTPSQTSHFTAYQKADIALDPMPFNGLTISLELITMGVPVLTLPGESMQSRGCARINYALKLDELVASSDIDYVNKAVGLANNIKRLEKYRKTLRDKLLNSMLIKDTKGFAKAVEKAYERAWEQYCKNY